MQRLGSGAMPSAAEAGLPPYVLDALFLAAVSAPKHRTHISGTIPRPIIELEPFGGLGPVAAFPTVEPEDAAGTWTLIGDAEILKSKASSLSEAPVRITPGKEFHGEYSGADGTWRGWSFVGLRDQGVLRFDAETDVLLRDTGALSAEEVWLLVPRDTKVVGRARSTGAEIEPRQAQGLPEISPYRESLESSRCGDRRAAQQ